MQTPNLRALLLSELPHLLEDFSPESRMKALEKAIGEMSPAELEVLEYDWTLWARPEQLPPPGDWTFWIYLAGRGAGKTRTGAEFVKASIAAGARRVALVGPTLSDVRDTMIFGDSGLMSVYPRAEKPRVIESKRKMIFSSGAIATMFTSEEPERLRGPQHDLAWCDELAAWQYVQGSWDNLLFGLRRGARPRAFISTTPKPLPLIRGLLKDPTCVVTRGSTHDNRANLAPSFFEQVIKRYEGTRLGRQEIYAEVLDDIEGALWSTKMIDAARADRAPDLVRVVVAIDPAVTAKADSDETGIVCAGLGVDGKAYVLDDLSGILTADQWARRALNCLDERKGDRVIGEVNNGGDLIERTIRTQRRLAPFKAVRATRGKMLRAEPVAALYEQGRVKHVGEFQMLEKQMLEFVPGLFDGSPDRLDAMVWAITELMLDSDAEPRVRSL